MVGAKKVELYHFASMFKPKKDPLQDFANDVNTTTKPKSTLNPYLAGYDDDLFGSSKVHRAVPEKTSNTKEDNPLSFFSFEEKKKDEDFDDFDDEEDFDDDFVASPLHVAPTKVQETANNEWRQRALDAEEKLKTANATIKKLTEKEKKVTCLW